MLFGQIEEFQVQVLIKFLVGLIMVELELNIVIDKLLQDLKNLMSPDLLHMIKNKYTKQII